MPLKYKFQGDQILQNIKTGGNKLRGNQFFVTYPLKFYTHLQSGPVTSVFSIVSTHCNIEIINYSWWHLCFSFVETLVPGGGQYIMKKKDLGGIYYLREGPYISTCH